MFTSGFKRSLLTGALLATTALARRVLIDRSPVRRSAKSRKLTEIENPTAQPGYKPVQMPMPKTGDRVVQRQFTVAERLQGVLQGSGARARIGDILTVTVNITDKANFANETQRSRHRQG